MGTPPTLVFPRAFRRLLVAIQALTRGCPPLVWEPEGFQRLVRLGWGKEGGQEGGTSKGNTQMIKKGKTHRRKREASQEQAGSRKTHEAGKQYLFGGKGKQTAVGGKTVMSGSPTTMCAVLRPSIMKLTLPPLPGMGGVGR